MYRLVISELAHNDLEHISDYIVTELASPNAAIDFLDDVAKCYERLRENPFLYEQCRDLRLQKEGYRRAVIKNYILIYKVLEPEKEVVIYRFFYGRQEYLRLI